MSEEIIVESPLIFDDEETDSTMEGLSGPAESILSSTYIVKRFIDTVLKKRKPYLRVLVNYWRECAPRDYKRPLTQDEDQAFDELLQDSDKFAANMLWLSVTPGWIFQLDYINENKIIKFVDYVGTNTYKGVRAVIRGIRSVLHSSKDTRLQQVASLGTNLNLFKDPKIRRELAYFFGAQIYKQQQENPQLPFHTEE